MAVVSKALRACSVALLATLVVVAAPVHAADPGAPAGASADWLPSDAWVQQQWLPFDEAQMLGELGIDRLALQVWIAGDRRSLRSLAWQRGVNPGRLLRRLVAPWPLARQREMLARARLAFSQPHLAQHLFFHTLHLSSVNGEWSRIFGIDVAGTYAEMYAEGLCYLEVGARHRGSSAAVQASLAAVVRGAAREGVRRGELLPAQARVQTALRLERAQSVLVWRLGQGG